MNNINNDLISRQALCEYALNQKNKSITLNDIMRFPSAQPRMRGRWTKGINENGVTTSLFCSECNYENKHWYEWNYCPNCGADMRTKETDYDYERAVEQLEHDILYKPTFNQDDGSM